MNTDTFYWLQNNLFIVAGFMGFIGLLIGSFLNVVIFRLPKRLEWQWKEEARLFIEDENSPQQQNTEEPPSIVPHSRCSNCGHKIRPWENIPVVSYIFLRGKCSSCKTKLSLQYPLVELATGLLFALATLTLGIGWPLAFALVGISLLIAMTGIDFNTQLLPDQLTYPFLWIGLAGAAAGVSSFPSAPAAILGALIGYLSLWSIFWLFKLVTGKEGMGYGDFKLMAGLGAWCGAQALIPIALVACALGIIVGVIMILRGRDKRVPFAFGPYLALAGLIEILAGGWLWRLLGIPV